MNVNFMMIGMIIWTILTSANYFHCHNPLMGGVFACYAVANVFLFIIGAK